MPIDVVKVKICGLTTPEAVVSAANYGADYLGFIFYPPSPRAVTVEQAVMLRKALPEKLHASIVAVCVNPDDHLLQDIMEHFKPDYLQLHGDESPERAASIHRQYKIPLIKAFSIAEAQDFERVAHYVQSVDMLLFDTKSQEPSIRGGTGRAFDWSLLKNQHFSLPWFLSGGLGGHNIIEAISKTQACYVDLSSSLESSVGVKDPDKIKQCLTLLGKRVAHDV